MYFLRNLFLWCYSCYQPLYDELLKEIKMYFVEGIPAESQMNSDLI
jgi:hypothetical protein